MLFRSTRQDDGKKAMKAWLVSCGSGEEQLRERWDKLGGGERRLGSNLGSLCGGFEDLSRIPSDRSCIAANVYYSSLETKRREKARGGARPPCEGQFGGPGCQPVRISCGRVVPLDLSVLQISAGLLPFKSDTGSNCFRSRLGS